MVVGEVGPYVVLSCDGWYLDSSSIHRSQKDGSTPYCCVWAVGFPRPLHSINHLGQGKSSVSDRSSILEGEDCGLDRLRDRLLLKSDTER